MTAPVPTRAMVLAAGLGSRMGALTEDRPKPLIRVGGRALIDHALDRLQAVGVGDVVVNLFYLADHIRDHLAGRSAPATQYSEETERLETGGGVTNALGLLGDEAFYVVNADAFWLNGSMDALGRLAASWDDETMDGLLLLHSTVDAYGYDGRGDFLCAADGRLTRRPESEVAPWLFTGIQILHPRLFRDAPEGAFSLNLLYDRALEAERLFGVVHDGEWFHVGTPEGLDEAETYLGERFAETKHR